MAGQVGPSAYRADAVEKGLITERDKHGNWAVDIMAKKGRDTIAVPQDLLDRAKAVVHRVELATRTVGDIGAAVVNGDIVGDRIKEKGRRRQRDRARRQQCEEEQARQDRHVPTRIGDAWRCLQCGRTAKTREKLIAKKCAAADLGGDEQAQSLALLLEAAQRESLEGYTKGHILLAASPYIFCVGCGAYGSGAGAVKLHKQCTPCQPVYGRDRVLKRLMRGSHPYSEARLGKVADPPRQWVVQVIWRGGKAAAGPAPEDATEGPDAVAKWGPEEAVGLGVERYEGACRRRRPWRVPAWARPAVLARADGGQGEGALQILRRSLWIVGAP